MIPAESEAYVVNLIAAKAEKHRLKKEECRVKAYERSKKWREDNPEKERASCSKWRAANLEFSRAKGRRWHRENKERSRWTAVKRKFGLSREQWEAIFTSQGNKCAICPATEPGGQGGWHTDHCHKTGKVRGILCSKHNAGLGLFDDNEDILIAAAAYVRKHRECAQLP